MKNVQHESTPASRADHCGEQVAAVKLAWVAPHMERLSLKEALQTTHTPASFDGSANYS
jgi:hypothetical protein